MNCEPGRLPVVYGEFAMGSHWCSRPSSADSVCYEVTSFPPSTTSPATTTYVHHCPRQKVAIGLFPDRKREEAALAKCTCFHLRPSDPVLQSANGLRENDRWKGYGCCFVERSASLSQGLGINIDTAPSALHELKHFSSTHGPGGFHTV